MYPGPFRLFLWPLHFVLMCQRLSWKNSDYSQSGEEEMFMMEQIYLVLIPYVFMFVYMISQKRELQTTLLKFLLHKQKDLDFTCSLGTVSCLSLHYQCLAHKYLPYEWSNNSSQNCLIHNRSSTSVYPHQPWHKDFIARRLTSAGGQGARCLLIILSEASAQSVLILCFS